MQFIKPCAKKNKVYYKKLSVLTFSFFALLIPSLSSAQTETTLVLKVNTFSKNIPYGSYSEWFSLAPSLSFDESYLSEIENIDFCHVENIFCQLTKTERLKMHTKKSVSISFNNEKARSFLEKTALEADVEPVNAKFKMDGEKVSLFVPDQAGFKIDIEKSLEIISQSFATSDDLQRPKELSLPYVQTYPEIKSADINNLGIDSLIGQGKSNFKGSPKSRIHNITVATKKYDGFLLAPGEEFSFVEILGPVDGEHGYLPELVIKQDRTEPEFGGGICQVSTTAFRAAIYSGLEITARKNHAYPVQYYSPHGMDATIYVPKPDLRFKNNTPGHILIQTEITGTELTFNFFGTSDGRKIDIDGPHIIEKNPDGSMRTTFAQKVIDKNGSVVINDTFNSFYDSPSKYPHPGEEKITKKPEDWSKKQWEEYKKTNGL